MLSYSGAQSHADPVSHPEGSRSCASKWYPTTDIPAAFAALITVDWQSWCWVRTSTPCEMSAVAADPCFRGSHHSEVATVYVTAFGFTDWAPSSKASTLSTVWGIGKA